MAYFLQQLINGLTLGSIYGLIAIGYTMVYGIIGMINFAHGEIYMIGAFISIIAFLALGLGPAWGIGFGLPNRGTEHSFLNQCMLDVGQTSCPGEEASSTGLTKPPPLERPSVPVRWVSPHATSSSPSPRMEPCVFVNGGRNHGRRMVCHRAQESTRTRRILCVGCRRQVPDPHESQCPERPRRAGRSKES